jgi:putative transposase
MLALGQLVLKRRLSCRVPGVAQQSRREAASGPEQYWRSARRTGIRLPRRAVARGAALGCHEGESADAQEASIGRADHPSPARSGGASGPGGQTVGEARRRVGVSEQSYHRWRKEYGRLKVEQARRLRELEQENARLKRAVANVSLEKQVLKDLASGNF